MFNFKSLRAPLALAVVPLFFIPHDAHGDESESTAPAVDEVVVIAQRLNEARNGIQTQTGASTYTINESAIDAAPGGDNQLLNQVIMQAPDVAQDSFGQFHVRGEHNGLQYRLNGIILPEGISVFGQSLDPRLISSLTLVTGALPAEYGLRTAGIIDLKTKSGESSTLTTRVDLINALDKVYEIRNGTGVGVGAPQFGPRRGLFLGISKSI